MDKENNIVYVETKKGIFKCYKSEQMHKSIYYPVESKTSGYIDYNEVISTLTIDDLYKQVKKQKEVIDMVSARLEYFLIGNLKYQSSQEEFIKLLNILKGVENE